MKTVDSGYNSLSGHFSRIAIRFTAFSNFCVELRYLVLKISEVGHHYALNEGTKVFLEMLGNYGIYILTADALKCVIGGLYGLLDNSLWWSSQGGWRELLRQPCRRKQGKMYG